MENYEDTRILEMEKDQDTRIYKWKIMRILEFRNGKRLGYQNLEMEKGLGYQTRIQEWKKARILESRNEQGSGYQNLGMGKNKFNVPN